MVIDGVLESFDDIALDCKDFQPDDIYTCVIGNEIVDVGKVRCQRAPREDSSWLCKP